MKFYRRTLLILLVILMFSFMGCGDKKQANNKYAVGNKVQFNIELMEQDDYIYSDECKESQDKIYTIKKVITNSDGNGYSYTLNESFDTYEYPEKYLQPADTTTYSDSTSNVNNSDSDEVSSKDLSDDIICKYGEEKITGQWNIKVLDAKESSSVSINDGENKETSEKFITVKLKLENKSSEPAQWNPNDFTVLESGVNSKYQCNFDITQGIGARETIYNENDKVLEMYTDLNPGLSRECYICFEVPKSCNINNCSIAYVDESENEYCGYMLK